MSAEYLRLFMRCVVRMNGVCLAFFLVFIVTADAYVSVSLYAAEPAPKNEQRLESTRQVQRFSSHARDILEAKEWHVSLKSLGTHDSDAETDVLRFHEGNLHSRYLASLGFSQSPYLASVEENGAIAWEALFVADNHGMASLKGTLQKDRMEGVIAFQTLNGDIFDYYFSSFTPVKAPQKEASAGRESESAENGRKKKNFFFFF